MSGYLYRRGMDVDLKFGVDAIDERLDFFFLWRKRMRDMSGFCWVVELSGLLMLCFYI